LLDLPETEVGEIINGRLVTHHRLTAKLLFAKTHWIGPVVPLCSRLARRSAIPEQK